MGMHNKQQSCFMTKRKVVGGVAHALKHWSFSAASFILPSLNDSCHIYSCTWIGFTIEKGDTILAQTGERGKTRPGREERRGGKERCTLRAEQKKLKKLPQLGIFD